MRTRNSLAILVFSLFCLAASSASAAIDELERTLRPGLGVIDRIICVDGVKFFQTTGMGGAATIPVISTIQIYETKSGKVVPATCKPKP
jgi:hypothetical protein